MVIRTCRRGKSPPSSPISTCARRPPPGRRRRALGLAPIGHDLPRYRGIYEAVGEPWLWSSRVLTDDAALRTILEDPAVEAFALRDGSADIGLLELDFRVPGACELAFLGVVPRAIGTGAGRFLMNAAIRRAFAQPIARFWLHTCTLDHPGAVAFYMRSGFRPYRRAIEIEDDPRLTGHMPREAAPHAPVIEAPRASSPTPVMAGLDPATSTEPGELSQSRSPGQARG